MLCLKYVRSVASVALHLDRDGAAICQQLLHSRIAALPAWSSSRRAAARTECGRRYPGRCDINLVINFN